MESDRGQTEPWVLRVSDDTTEATSGECSHDSRRHLGGDAGGNVYFRCEECESVLIQEGTVSWQEHRETREEALAEREQGDNPLRGLLESEEGGIFDRGESARGRTEASTDGVTVRLRRVIRRIRGR